MRITYTTLPGAITVVIGCLVSAVSGAGQLQAQPDQKYLIIEVAKLDTFEKELGDAAKQGFRLIMASTDQNGGRIQAFLERTATPPDVFQYRMVATVSEKTGDKEMNAAGADGFRVVPHTSMVKKGLTIFNVNSVVVMEKPPLSTHGFEYKSISAVKTSTFHRELQTAVDGGWKAVDMIYGKVIVERQAKP